MTSGQGPHAPGFGGLNPIGQHCVVVAQNANDWPCHLSYPAATGVNYILMPDSSLTTGDYCIGRQPFVQFYINWHPNQNDAHRSIWISNTIHCVIGCLKDDSKIFHPHGKHNTQQETVNVMPAMGRLQRPSNKTIVQAIHRKNTCGDVSAGYIQCSSNETRPVK